MVWSALFGSHYTAALFAPAQEAEVVPADLLDQICEVLFLHLVKFRLSFPLLSIFRHQLNLVVG